MARFFNSAGPCRPGEHYMLPPERRLPGVAELIERGQYFVVHAPRQSGKTTAFRTLATRLTAEGRYAALWTSCEAGQRLASDFEGSIATVLAALLTSASSELPAELRPPPIDSAQPAGNRLTDLLTRWAAGAPRPLVLFFDEIDALFDDALVSVLRQLRSGYSRRPQHFPHAVSLIGLRDVRDYRLSPDGDRLGSASPFNVKVESLTLRNFDAEEVAELYGQHTAETGQRFSAAALEHAYGLTGGQPWLVNALAREVVERIATDPKVEVEVAQIAAAAENLIVRRDTHLDSLIDRLREPRVRRVIEPILAGALVLGDRIEDDVAYTEDLGLVTRSGGHLRIANSIYHEVIPRALASITQSTIYHETRWYVGPDGRLELDRLLRGFVEFWREHGEPMLASQPYHEVAAQLVLMSFLQRILNGGGRLDREYAVGSGRLDLCLRWPTPLGEQREALELKTWRDGQADPEKKGIDQLAHYLERLGLEEGTLVIFDQRKAAAPIAERGTFSEQRRGPLRFKVLKL